ncbi:HIL-like protein [Mya arenaria]|uniref:HIL-like protein n=1 Tax=Mya arenaria TaxID=6604 RepID=A0ABY7FR86_MYAAR|nr:HIL-like protein [Mya arenaria]
MADTDSIERGFQRLSSIFRPPVLDSHKCYRCKDTVYHAEKMGPVHEVVYHKGCFRCVVCDNNLTMKNYFTSQVDANDRDLYCINHYPRVGAARYGKGAIGISGAVRAQENFRKMSKKLDQQVRKPGTVRIPSYDASAIAIKRILTSPKAAEYTAAVNIQANVSLPPDAMGIKGPIAAQKMQHQVKASQAGHMYQPKYKKKLTEAQERLEFEHRKEEDALLQNFQINKEWEVKLKELTEMFERDMQKKKKKIDDREKKMMTVQFESQKRELEKSLRVKKDKKKETMTIRMKQKQQSLTSHMVTKQSEQMLDLLAQKKQDLRKELEKELEAQPPTMVDPQNEEIVKEIIETMEVLEQPKKSELPAPHPPACRKTEIYTDPNVFDELDDKVIQVAQDDQMTYTDLVSQLTDGLLTDLEKVRAIFRWVTVKDLNVMDFTESVDTDTPLGLLRGIKFGTETYHVLFMRLCSYAGLHCVEIKGHSKSVGYEPGMKIQPEMFQNTWNAVLIDGDWRLVQCNWGARHLVLNKDRKRGAPNDKPQENGVKNGGGKDKEKGDDKSSKSKDKIRYQYDEHYFLTDPDEFIQEFWPNDSKWQLLEVAITRDEFEALPFVRSVFFHFGMRFDKTMGSVIDTNERGGADIRIRIPEKYENDLVFYYQLRFADTERKLEATYRGANLERFVFQTTMDNTAMFSIHVPTTGEYYFEIFANKIDESNKIGAVEDTISPFRLKCACKFKIRCKTLKGKMHPLPDCAAGEWGPKKAVRHFGLQPVVTEPSDTSSDSGSTSSNDSPENPKAGILNVEDSISLKFRMPMQLQFVAKLKMNNVEQKSLDPFVYHSVENNVLTITATMPQLGQYGLDLYAKPRSSEAKTLSHACKYLLNAVKVSHPVELQKINRSFARRGTIGPAPSFEEMGIKLKSHTDPQITMEENDHETCIEIEVPEDIEVSCQLMREPDEEHNEYVKTIRDDKDRRFVKFKIDLAKHGNYLFCIYARRLRSDGGTPNVFNYVIAHKKKNPLFAQQNAVPEQVTFEEKKTGGLLRKSIFGSKKKDKDKKK